MLGKPAREMLLRLDDIRPDGLDPRHSGHCLGACGHGHRTVVIPDPDVPGGESARDEDRMPQPLPRPIQENTAQIPASTLGQLRVDELNRTTTTVPSASTATITPAGKDHSLRL